ncbi:MAG: response regulator transcription factor [Bacteroidia bacterium]|nr:response regulator transcription factor [Bacteroidia bacterium]
MKCLVIDDEELARALLENFIQRLPDLELLAKCKNPLEALDLMSREKVDLIFLDIQMPELNGLDFLNILAEKPMIIFTTAYSEHALDAFNLNALDYLHKPFSFQRFLQALAKAREKYHFRKTSKQAEHKKENPSEEAYLLVHADHKVHKLWHKDILYVQSMREYVTYHLKDHKLMALNSLKKLEEVLPGEKFTRIHKSYLVANDQVNALEGNQLHIGEILLPIGGSFKEEVVRKLFS